MKTLVIIPARYASTRFPGKPLAMLGGKPIVDYAYVAAQAAEGVERAVVATDDERIYSHMAATFGNGSVMMTLPSHRSGTDRCGEVLQRLEATGEKYDVVINLQGDEPFVDNNQIGTLMACMAQGQTDIATLCTPIASDDELLSPNNVKVVCTARGQALYFSRAPIPFMRDVPEGQWTSSADYSKHVGMYAFRSKVLHEVCALPSASLEECEKLEQLRWLEAGYSIAVCRTDHANIGIDTPDDLAAAEQMMAQKSK